MLDGIPPSGLAGSIPHILVGVGVRLSGSHRDQTGRPSSLARRTRILRNDPRWALDSARVAPIDIGLGEVAAVAAGEDGRNARAGAEGQHRRMLMFLGR